MKWFDKWFYKKCKQAWDNSNQYDGNVKVPNRTLGGLAIAEDPHDLNDGLRIDVKKVIGGSVITFRTYDRQKDRSDSRSYIITDEQEFDKELGKMITMESMRR